MSFLYANLGASLSLWADTAQEQGLDLEPPVPMEEEKEVMEEMEMEIEDPLPCLSEADTQGIIKGRDLFGYVGIEAVLDQMRRKTMKAGFEFNIMVVGKWTIGQTYSKLDFKNFYF